MEALMGEYVLLCHKFERLKRLARINLNLLFLSIDEEETPEAKVELDKVRELVQALKDDRESSNTNTSKYDKLCLDPFLDAMTLKFTEQEVMDSLKRYLQRNYKEKQITNESFLCTCSTPKSSMASTSFGDENDDDFNLSTISYEKLEHSTTTTTLPSSPKPLNIKSSRSTNSDLLEIQSQWQSVITALGEAPRIPGAKRFPAQMISKSSRRNTKSENQNKTAKEAIKKFDLSREDKNKDKNRRRNSSNSGKVEFPAQRCVGRSTRNRNKMSDCINVVQANVSEKDTARTALVGDNSDSMELQRNKRKRVMKSKPIHMDVICCDKDNDVDDNDDDVRDVSDWNFAMAGDPGDNTEPVKMNCSNLCGGSGKNEEDSGIFDDKIVGAQAVFDTVEVTVCSSESSEKQQMVKIHDVDAASDTNYNSVGISACENGVGEIETVLVEGISDERNNKTDNSKESQTEINCCWSVTSQDAIFQSQTHLSELDSCSTDKGASPFGKVYIKNKDKKSRIPTKQNIKLNKGKVPEGRGKVKAKKKRITTASLLEEFGIPSALSNPDTHSKDPLVCPVCSREYRWKQSFLAHLKVHKCEKDGDTEASSKLEPLLCTICGKTLKNRASLYQHHQHHKALEKGEYLKCPVCGKEYLGKHSLRFHMRYVHILKKSYMCDACGKAYKRKKMLKDHMLSVHLDTKEGCEVCGKGFSSKANLSRHMRIHRGDMPYSCPICGKRFRSSDNRNNHEKRHTGNFPYRCSLCDSLGFISPGQLRSHERRVHLLGGVGVGETCGVNDYAKARRHKSRLRPDFEPTKDAKQFINYLPHRCETCGKEYPTSANLRRHSLLHTGLKPHKCSTCGRVFSTNDTLKAHMWTHSNVKQFPCDVCDKGFNDKRNFASHMKRVHPEHSTAITMATRQTPVTTITTTASVPSESECLPIDNKNQEYQ